MSFRAQAGAAGQERGGEKFGGKYHPGQQGGICERHPDRGVRGEAGRCGRAAGRHCGHPWLGVVLPAQWHARVGQTGDGAQRHPVSPGPHAVLLVVRACTSVEERYRREIQEHLELLGEGVWKHTLVLFTWGERLDNATMEQRIQNGGTDLRTLVERCGNRFHVLSNEGRPEAAQVVELLKKVDEMSAGNSRVPFEMELQEQEDKRWRTAEQRRSQRLFEEQKMEVSLQELFAGVGCKAAGRAEESGPPGCALRLPDLRVVLLGERET
ncbi:hypothetical protein AAFF_G00433890, partial [Aldrovandia affinis]